VQFKRTQKNGAYTPASHTNSANSTCKLKMEERRSRVRYEYELTGRYCVLVLRHALILSSTGIGTIPGQV